MVYHMYLLLALKQKGEGRKKRVRVPAPKCVMVARRTASPSLLGANKSCSSKNPKTIPMHTNSLSPRNVLPHNIKLFNLT